MRMTYCIKVNKNNKKTNTENKSHKSKPNELFRYNRQV